jgi:hypothetical protein
VGNVHIAWPTKLALAPDLVDRFEIELAEQNIRPDSGLNHQQIDQAMPTEFACHSGGKSLGEIIPWSSLSWAVPG